MMHQGLDHHKMKNTVQKFVLVALGALYVLGSSGCQDSGPQGYIKLLTPYEDTATGKWGYMTANGDVQIEPQFFFAGDYSTYGLAPVADSMGWHYIDLAGEKIIRPYVFDNGPDPFQDGLARYIDAGSIGFFDQSGQIIIEAQYDFVMPFSEGLAAFCEDCSYSKGNDHTTIEGGRWGYINRQGKVAITPRFEMARSFNQGQAQVQTDQGPGKINRMGTLIEE